MSKKTETWKQLIELCYWGDTEAWARVREIIREGQGTALIADALAGYTMPSREDRVFVVCDTPQPGKVHLIE